MAEQRKPHLSWSQLSMFMRCPQQYYRRYREGEIIPPAIAMIKGSATDRGVQTALTRKIETGELAPLEECQQTARDYVTAEFKRGAYWLDPEQRAQDKPKEAWRSDCVEAAVDLTGLHRTKIAPALDPTAVQRGWRLLLDGFPFDLMGYIDICEEHATYDVKTSTKAPPQNAAHVSDQLTTYAMFRRVADALEDGDLALQVLVRTHKKHQLKYQMLWTERDDEDYRIFLRRIEAVAAGIEAGAFPPCDRSAWNCDPTWCGYYETCPYVRGRKVFSLGR